ncbi:hypothetical protein CAPTEDRAFT_197873 [Capitella teleta]|uniref:Uncharacterized protein n=1 Tax=Capitella teleta TaxID=283909 RepID=R7UW40_CAPTE|nr:hypothetical protein CAPTEDRAFT_197873 [Capitella teleta]|eukprot:ELU10848.1 hypothetical protein CAPTEDRAFT_197873 [Capitella teleta]
MRNHGRKADKSSMDPALLSEIFKWLLKKPGGSCKMRTLIKDFPLVVSANSLIAQIAVYPNIFLLLDKGNPMESTLRAYIPSVQVCSKYYRKGQCGDKNCSSLHLCHSRLYHNFCRGSCLNHCNITASSLSGFSNDQKQILLRNSCLTVCSGYNTSHGCSNMEQYGSCPFVHVCVEAVQGTCTAGKGCPWNHSLLGEAHHKELYASRHITIDERTEHSLMTKLLIMPVVHILLVFLVQSGKDGASGEELELFLGINRKEVGIFVQAITKQANVHEKKVILRMSKFQICPYYNMGTECLCSGKAFHICAMYIMNKCRKCSLSHDVCDEYNEGLFTNNNCSHLSIWRRRQALRNSALVMCEEYALNGKCSNKACCAMHLCARWITNSCTSSCNKVHTFKTLHNIEVISVHDLSPWNDTELKMKIATVSIHVAKNDLKVNLDDTGVPPTSTDAMSTKDRKRHKTQEEPCKNVEVIGEGAELAKSPECLKLPQKTKEAALSRGHPSLPGAIKNINPKMEQPLDFCLHHSKSDLELPSKRLDKLRDCAEGNMAEQKYGWNAADERKSEAIKEKHEQKIPLSEFIVDEVAQGNSTDVSQLANVVSEVNVDVIQFCEEDTPLEFNVEESHPREVNIPHELNAEESQVCEETIQELISDESQPYEETVQFYEDTNQELNSDESQPYEETVQFHEDINQELNSDESQPYEETVQFHEDINQELNSELSNFNGDISQKTNVNESQPIEGIVMQELAACNIQPDFNSTIEFNAAKGELSDNTTQKPVTDQKPVYEHSNDIDVEHNVANSRLSKELSTESKELEEVKELASMEIEVNPLSENNETIEDQCEKEPVFIPATEEVDKVLPVAGEDTLSTTTQNTQLGDMCAAGRKSDASRNSERSVDTSDLQTSHKEIHGNIEQIAENMRLQLNDTKEFDFCWKWLADDGTWHPYVLLERGVYGSFGRQTKKLKGLLSPGKYGVYESSSPRNYRILRVFEPRNAGTLRVFKPRNYGILRVFEPKNAGTLRVFKPRNYGILRVFEPRNDVFLRVFMPRNYGILRVFAPRNYGILRVFAPRNDIFLRVYEPRSDAFLRVFAPRNDGSTAQRATGSTVEQ